MKLTKLALSIFTLAVISTSSIAANYTVKIPLEVSSIGFDKGTPIGEKTCEAWLPSADDFGTNETVSQSRNCTQDYEYKNGNVKEKSSDEDREVAGNLNPLLTTPITGTWEIRDITVAVVQNQNVITSIHRTKIDYPSIYFRKVYGTSKYLIDVNLLLTNSEYEKIKGFKLITPNSSIVFNRSSTPANRGIKDAISNESPEFDFNSIAVGQPFTIEILR